MYNRTEETTMRRYGDNVSKEEPEEEGKQNQGVQVMYGGCGYGAGTFVKPPKAKKRFNLLRRLGLKRDKAQEQA
jgi:hypothetical protein